MNTLYSLVYVFFLCLYKNCLLLLKLFYINICLKFEIPSPIGIYESMYLQWGYNIGEGEIDLIVFYSHFWIFSLFKYCQAQPCSIQLQLRWLGWDSFFLNYPNHPNTHPTKPHPTPPLSEKVG